MDHTRIRTSPRRKDAELAFDALRVEGGLLAPEWLAKVSRLEGGDQAEADYGVPKGLNLRDEIGRYWRIAQAHHAEFAAGLAAKAEPRLVAERFILAMLREVFGFATLGAVEAMVIAERVYPIGFGLGTRVPVVIAPAGLGLDTLSPAFGEGGRRRSAFGLAQEYLNAAADATWGVVTDGVTLRIARDNASLTRPAWIEADLGRIFAEGLFADFAALWLLAHASRFGKADRPGAECALETWREKGREEGTRAREHLRRGVEDAVAALGQGFLSHPANGALRAALESGELSDQGLFNQLLRLVYRLIFLLTVEERGLLHPAGVSDDARAVYAEGYSVRRLRERSTRRSAHDRHTDAWDAIRIVFRGLAGGEPRLGLPALAGLFAASQCPALDAAKLENRWLLLAVFKLAWLRDKGGLARVNWRDMGPEELGSVYESLLELVPVVSVAARSFSFAGAGDGNDNVRHSTGSYYTPDSLVQILLDSALELVVKETIGANPGRPVEALLSLSVVDPACGSGHFLLAAARRLAGHVARIEANGTPSAAEYRHALRKVVGRCIYGVDLNPMAVELCKVALWMEAVEPGLPLTFLDAHVQDGNALLGTTPELMAKGIPDAAWEATEGDDRKVASALKKRNAKEASGQTTMASMWSKPAVSESDEVARAVADLEAAPDTDADALAAKETRWAGILRSGAYRHQKFVADAWCAAFVWPKPSGGGPLVEAAPTMALWRDLRDGKGVPPELTVKMVEELAEQYHFFHWHLAFPTVFAKGGFDVVLGNPPYGDSESMNPNVRSFVGRRWTTARGNWDLYVAFVEAAANLVRLGGYQAQVTPNKLLGSDYAASIQKLLLSRSILTVWDFTGWKVFVDAAVDVVIAVIRNTRAGGSDTTTFVSRMTGRTTVATLEDLLALPDGYISYPLSGSPGEYLPLLTSNVRLKSVATVSDGATTGEAYELRKLVQDEPRADSSTGEWVRLVNTGTIDPFELHWGREKIRYLGFVGLYPAISAAMLVQSFPARATQAMSEKVVIAGLSTRLEAAVAPKGWLCGKSVNQVIPQPGVCAYAIAVLLNSHILNRLYSGLFGMRGLSGVWLNVGSRQLELLPVPGVAWLIPAPETPEAAAALLVGAAGMLVAPEPLPVRRLDALSLFGRALHASNLQQSAREDLLARADEEVARAFGLAPPESR
jgi:hypothetical protein